MFLCFFFVFYLALCIFFCLILCLQFVVCNSMLALTTFVHRVHISNTAQQHMYTYLNCRAICWNAQINRIYFSCFSRWRSYFLMRLIVHSKCALFLHVFFSKQRLLNSNTSLNVHSLERSCNRRFAYRYLLSHVEFLSDGRKRLTSVSLGN